MPNLQARQAAAPVRQGLMRAHKVSTQASLQTVGAVTFRLKLEAAGVSIQGSCDMRPLIAVLSHGKSGI